MPNSHVESSFKDYLETRGVLCHGFLKRSARLGYSWQRFGTSQAERGPRTVTMETLPHHAGISGESLQ